MTNIRHRLHLVLSGRLLCASAASQADCLWLQRDADRAWVHAGELHKPAKVLP